MSWTMQPLPWVQQTVEPHVNGNKYIVYPQLFDELKALCYTTVDAMFFLFCTCLFYINKLNLFDSVCYFFY